jgi:F-type H+-transporting ATPase subunit a
MVEHSSYGTAGAVEQVSDTLHAIGGAVGQAVQDTLYTVEHAVVDTVEHVAEAAGGAEHGETVDIVHHISNLGSIETPFGTIDLTPLQFNLFGIDMSITKPVIFMWLAGLILLLCFMLAFRGGKLLRNKFAQLLEVYVLFVRDEVVYPNVGEEDGRRLLPFFLTVFFFILSMNLLGMVPYGSTATANINVTAGMAIIAFLFIQGMGMVKNGFVHHWKNMLPSGLPVFVIPIMIPVEIVGMFAKPFALCIRLFANMVAGHAVILVLLSLIIMGKSYILAPMPVAGVLFISVLEIFVAHLQAFIFTILTALFVSMTLHPGH